MNKGIDKAQHKHSPHTDTHIQRLASTRAYAGMHVHTHTNTSQIPHPVRKATWHCFKHLFSG